MGDLVCYIVYLVIDYNVKFATSLHVKIVLANCILRFSVVKVDDEININK